YRRRQFRFHHRRAIPQALHRGGHGMGASGYRRRRLAGRRAKAHGSQLGYGVGRASARSAGARALRNVTETLFYHLERRALEDVLPGLLEKSLERGWRAVIRTDSSERSDAIDNLLWTYDEQSFLAHAQSGDGDPARQPVLISVEDE